MYTNLWNLILFDVVYVRTQDVFRFICVRGFNEFSEFTIDVKYIIFNMYIIIRKTYTEKNTGVYLKKTVVELTKIFIKTQPTTLVVELMNKIRKSHFVINLTNLFVNITKKIHYVNDAAFVDLTHLFVNPTKYFYKIFFFKIII